MANVIGFTVGVGFIYATVIWFFIKGRADLRQYGKD